MEYELFHTHADEETTESTSQQPSKKLNLKEIVIFKDKIYAVIDGGGGLLWGIEYFLYKIINTYKTLPHHVSDYSEFSLEHEFSQKLIFYRNNEELKKRDSCELYKDYQENKILLTGESDETIQTKHLKILQKKIIHKLLDVPSKETLLSREKFHRQIIADTITHEIEELPRILYEAADKAHPVLIMKFLTLNENKITQHKTNPPFYNFPCADGKIYPTFEAYFYYLCEGIFQKYDDETVCNQTWLAARLQERIQAIFPHLNVESQSQAQLIPMIIIKLNIGEINFIS